MALLSVFEDPTDASRRVCEAPYQLGSDVGFRLLLSVGRVGAAGRPPPQAGVRLGGPGGNAPSRAPQGSADHALRTARLAPSLGTRRRSSFVEVEEDVHAASDFLFKSLGDLVNRK